MNTLRDLFRNTKLSYAVYNFFQKKKLQHNVALYRKYGLKKEYYSPISSSDFKHIEGQFVRKENVAEIKNTSFYQSTSLENQKSLDDYFKNGYAIIRNFISDNDIQNINNDIERLLSDGEIEFSYGNKLMFAFKKSSNIKKIGENKGLLELLSVMMDGNAKLFQSINFIHGSEQKTHSDSIHMTTFPLGGLIGVWIALEDIHQANGPLHYYPESHRLPYYLNSDYGNEGNWMFLGKKGYKEYERMLEDKIQSLQLEKKVFHAKKGDMLIWHANILHGGEPHIDKKMTRKSMVFHYFDENSICYHEITQRPALFN